MSKIMQLSTMIVVDLSMNNSVNLFYKIRNQKSVWLYRWIVIGVIAGTQIAISSQWRLQLLLRDDSK